MERVIGTGRSGRRSAGAREIVGTIVTQDVRASDPWLRRHKSLPGPSRRTSQEARRALGRTLVGMVDAIVVATMIGAWRDAATLTLLSLEAFLPGLRTLRTDDRDGCPLALA